MPQSFSQLWIHIIFSTKQRFSFLNNSDVRQKLYDYMTAICRQNNCNPIIIGGIADHVHLLINLNKNVSLVHLIEK